MTTALHNFAATYLTLRENKLAALADAAEADGDNELAALYQGELERKIEVLSPPHLRVINSPSSSTPASSPRS